MMKLITFAKDVFPRRKGENQVVSEQIANDWIERGIAEPNPPDMHHGIQTRDMRPALTPERLYKRKGRL